QDLQQRHFKFVIRDGRAEPLLQLVRQMARGQPMRGEGEPTLRMVGRAKPAETPQTARQNEIGELLPLAPPMVPDAAQVMVRAGPGAGRLGRQQAADPEQARLQREGSTAYFQFASQ